MSLRGDVGGQQPTPGSFSFNLGDGPANALALSKDNSHVVVAGRNGEHNERSGNLNGIEIKVDVVCR